MEHGWEVPRCVRGFPAGSAGKESACNAGEPSSVDSWVGKIPWRRDRLPAPGFLGFAGGSGGKESACNAGDVGLIPGLARSPGGGHDSPPQYSHLENPRGQRSLVGYGSWDHEELDTTEQLNSTATTCVESFRGTEGMLSVVRAESALWQVFCSRPILQLRGLKTRRDSPVVTWCMSDSAGI